MVLIDFRFRHKCELNETYPQCDHKRGDHKRAGNRSDAGTAYRWIDVLGLLVEN